MSQSWVGIDKARLQAVVDDALAKLADAISAGKLNDSLFMRDYLDGTGLRPVIDKLEAQLHEHGIDRRGKVTTCQPLPPDGVPAAVLPTQDAAQ